MKVGLGLVTYNRPKMFERSYSSILKILSNNLDYIVVYNDGSDEEFQEEYQNIYTKYDNDKTVIINNLENHGVGYAKNRLMEYLLAKECDYIFIVEDDVEPIKPEAITGYIKVHRRTGISHLNFAHHGKLNTAPIYIDKPLVFWPHCVGAWSFYTKECLEEVGLIDEYFYNAWDHVEHTKRISKAGFTSPFWFFADCENSEKWIKEIPGAIQTSVIRNKDNWKDLMEDGHRYWREKDGQGIPQPPEFVTKRPWTW